MAANHRSTPSTLHPVAGPRRRIAVARALRRTDGAVKLDTLNAARARFGRDQRRAPSPYSHRRRAVERHADARPSRAPWRPRSGHGSSSATIRIGGQVSPSVARTVAMVSRFARPMIERPQTGLTAAPRRSRRTQAVRREPDVFGRLAPSPSSTTTNGRNSRRIPCRVLPPAVEHEDRQTQQGKRPNETTGCRAPDRVAVRVVCVRSDAGSAPLARRSRKKKDCRCGPPPVATSSTEPAPAATTSPPEQRGRGPTVHLADVARAEL